MKTPILTTPRMAALCVAAMLCSQVTAQTEALPNSPTPASSSSSSAANSNVNAQTDVTPRSDIDATARANANLNTTTKLSHSDRTFLEKAAKGGMKEVAVSQAVSGKLTGPGTRELAQMMITDHTAANEELKALAARKGFTLPADDHVAKEASRWAKNDKDVDDEYLEEMKDDHQEAIEAFERGAKTEDPEIAAFAQKMLPKLQQHLDHIKSLKKVN